MDTASYIHTAIDYIHYLLNPFDVAKGTNSYLVGKTKVSVYEIQNCYNPTERIRLFQL